MPGLCSHLNGEQRGAEALEDHLARAVRMNYAALKLSLNSKCGQCSIGGAESRGRVLCPEPPRSCSCTTSQSRHEDQHPWPLNWFTCLQRCPLPSSPNACCQRDSIIHSSIIALNCARYGCRHSIRYSRNATGGRNLPSGGLYSMVLLMCILMSPFYAQKFSAAPYGQLNKN